ncbi:hypothetical protein CVT26_014503 [Gymnopilus dilepis]|uniref:GCM domain-containing protein n=1 Tax=Gymnopilus dilepis TaxID=231916 RepID=A0A409WS80_9AGAR|nr:hypothetical protein CVT26_014503 [Gymnopilus dilepis]
MSGRPSSSFSSRWNITVNLTSNCGLVELDYASSSGNGHRADRAQADQAMRVNLVMNQQSGVEGIEPIERHEGPQHRQLVDEQPANPPRSLGPLTADQQEVSLTAGNMRLLEFPQGSQHRQLVAEEDVLPQRSLMQPSAEQRGGVLGHLEFPQGSQHRQSVAEQDVLPQRSLTPPFEEQSNARGPGELTQSSEHRRPAAEQDMSQQRSLIPPFEEQRCTPLRFSSLLRRAIEKTLLPPAHTRGLRELTQDSEHRRPVAEQDVSPQRSPSADQRCNPRGLRELARGSEHRRPVAERDMPRQRSLTLPPADKRPDPNAGEPLDWPSESQHHQPAVRQTDRPQQSPLPLVEESRVEGEDGFDWPQGFQRRRYIVGQEPSNWNHSKWQWHSNGYTKRHGCSAEVRICLGVIQCANPDCRNLLRPNTHAASRTRQLDGNCINKLCRLPSRLKYIQCLAKSYHYRAEHDGISYSVWEHEGTHSHPQPPPKGRRINIPARRTTTEPQHLTHTLPRSLSPPVLTKPATGFSHLNNLSPAASDHERSPSQISPRDRVSFPSGPGEKFTSCLANISEVQEELDSPFLVESSFAGPTYLVFQTSFMRRYLEEFVETHYLKSQEFSTALPLFITITDANRTLFKEGVFDATCIFDMTMFTWVPVSYTWARQHDTAHHKPHFRHLNQCIIDYIRAAGSKIEFDSKFVTHSVVMPGPQRSSRAEAYADAVLTTRPLFSALTPELQSVERGILISEARKADGDIIIHFWKSAQWLGANDSLVPSSDANKYWRLCGVMASDDSSFHDWRNAVTTLHDSFPKVGGWLSLWLQPAVASATFSACSQVDLVNLEDISGTTETELFPVLHRSEAYELVPGIKNLYCYAKGLEKRRDRIKVSGYDHVSHQGKTPLQLTTPSINLQSVHETPIHPTHSLQSYQWDNNSCFIDNGLELWFRAFSQWPFDSQSEFLRKVPTESFLGCLFFHYDRRLKQISREVSLETLVRNLSLMQTLTRHYVCEVWKVHLLGDYGCSKTWLTRAVKDKNPPRDIQGYFGVDHTVTRCCERGHSTNTFPSANPQVIFPLNDDEVRVARHTAGRIPVNLTDYFSHVIPRVPGGRDANATTALHKLPAELCSEPSCFSMAFITEITTRWPQILNISHYANVDPSQEVLYEDFVTISNSDGTTVVYELVGRAFHRVNHFVSQLRIGGEWYFYNDLKGHLEKSSNSNPMDDGYEPTYYVYHRRSLTAETIRRSECISKDYEIGQSVARPEPTFVPGEDQRTSASTGVASGGPRNTESLIKDFEVGQPVAPPEPTSVPDENAECISPPADVVSDDPHSGKIAFPGRVLQVYEPDAYVPCSDTCREKFGNLIDRTVSCLFCRKEWHEFCMEWTFSQNFFIGLGHPWGCPDCVNNINGAWDQYMIDEYILLRPEGSTRYFPAKVLGRSSTSQAHLQWYKGNIYQDETEAPEDSLTTSHPGACLIAYFYENYDYTQDDLGTIKWPIQFFIDAHNEYGYSNPLIMSALENSFHTVMEIVSFKVQHPIISLFKEWKEQMPAARGGSLPYLQQLFNVEQEFEHKFDIDILPGDESLIEPFFSEVYNVARSSMDAENPDHLAMVAKILFRLVVMRVYLAKAPQHDSQIYWLSLRKTDSSLSGPTSDITRSGHIVRHKSLPEQAALACFSPEPVHGHIPSKQCVNVMKDMAASEAFGHTSSRLHLQPDLETEPHFPIAQAFIGQDEYVFAATAEAGLAGGTAFRPREFDLFPPKSVHRKVDHGTEAELAPVDEALATDQTKDADANIEKKSVGKAKKSRKKRGPKGQLTELRRSKRLRQIE